jgi:Zn-dependent protease
MKNYLLYCANAGTWFGVTVYVHWATLAMLLIFSAVSWLHAGVLLICFASVIPHEFAHIWVARKHGIPCRRIFLTPIGGAAILENVPKSGWSEFLIAGVGPLSSFFIAFYFIPLLFVFSLTHPEFGPIHAFLLVIILANMLLATFNLLPVFPMDGGRMLRGILGMIFSFEKSMLYATRIGQVVGIFVSGFAFTIGLIAISLVLFIMTFISEIQLQSILYQTKTNTES